MRLFLKFNRSFALLFRFIIVIYYFLFLKVRIIWFKFSCYQNIFMMNVIHRTRNFRAWRGVRWTFAPCRFGGKLLRKINLIFIISHYFLLIFLTNRNHYIFVLSLYLLFDIFNLVWLYLLTTSEHCNGFSMQFYRFNSCKYATDSSFIFKKVHKIL
jgi:hypothetical protein